MCSLEAVILSPHSFCNVDIVEPVIFQSYVFKICFLSYSTLSVSLSLIIIAVLFDLFVQCYFHFWLQKQLLFQWNLAYSVTVHCQDDFLMSSNRIFSFTNLHIFPEVTDYDRNKPKVIYICQFLYNFGFCFQSVLSSLISVSVFIPLFCLGELSVSVPVNCSITVFRVKT